jgi:hypothetical protein
MKTPSSGNIHMKILILHVNNKYRPREVATAFSFFDEEIDSKKFQYLARPKASFLGRENEIPSMGIAETAEILVWIFVNKIAKMRCIPEEVFINVVGEVLVTTNNPIASRMHSDYTLHCKPNDSLVDNALSAL